MREPDLRPLSPNWIPPQLLAREKELGRLLDSWNSKEQENLWIWGRSGLGKTLTVKVFKERIEAEGGSVFIIELERIGLKNSIRKWAIDHLEKLRADDYLADPIIRVIERDCKDRKFALFFDNIDYLGKLIKRDLSPLLHTLYEHFTNAGYNFSISLITSRDYEQRKKILTPSVLSRLWPQSQVFPPYNKGEIEIILDQRLRFVFGEDYKKRVDKSALEALSDYIYREGSDIRIALDVARKVVKDTGAFKFEAVNEAIYRFDVLVWMEWINELSQTQKLLLNAIAHLTSQRLKESGIDEREWEQNPRISWHEVREAYKKLCNKKGITPLPDPSVRYNLSQLELKDWVETRILPRNHPDNYMKRRGLFVRLTNPCDKILEAFNELERRRSF